MKSMRILGATSVACGMALVLAGTAFADTAVVTNTGADSNNTTKVDNSTDFSSVNLNVTSVSNESGQVAVSGDTTANDNTNVANVGSGDVANSNNTSTVVSAGAGQGVSVTPPVQNCNCSTPVVSSKPAGGTGSVLGVSTVVPAMLPVTGATIPVDVSALRAAWKAPTTAPTTVLVQSARGLSTGMLGVASLLSLLGGLGSVLYDRRKERRV